MMIILKLLSIFALENAKIAFTPLYNALEINIQLII